MSHWLRYLTILVVLGLALMWLASYVAPWGKVWTARTRVWHVENRAGGLAVEIFSTTAEDPGYHRFVLPWWLAECGSLIVLGVLEAQVRRQREKARRGFPIQPPRPPVDPSE